MIRAGVVLSERMEMESPGIKNELLSHLLIVMAAKAGMTEEVRKNPFVFKETQEIHEHELLSRPRRFFKKMTSRLNRLRKKLQPPPRPC